MNSLNKENAASHASIAYEFTELFGTEILKDKDSIGAIIDIDASFKVHIEYADGSLTVTNKNSTVFYAKNCPENPMVLQIKNLEWIGRLRRYFDEQFAPDLRDCMPMGVKEND